jgi:hypothetical protein
MVWGPKALGSQGLESPNIQGPPELRTPKTQGFPKTWGPQDLGTQKARGSAKTWETPMFEGPQGADLETGMTDWRRLF